MPFIYLSRRELDRRFEEIREGVERSRKALDTEWNEWYDKFRRLYARLAKRVSQQEEGDAKNDDGAGAGVGGTSPSSDVTVNPEQVQRWRARRGF